MEFWGAWDFVFDTLDYRCVFDGFFFLLGVSSAVGGRPLTLDGYCSFRVPCRALRRVRFYVLRWVAGGGGDDILESLPPHPLLLFIS